MELFQSTQPIYLQIMELIKKEIVSDVLKSTQQLPTVRDLALKYQVNPNTVQRAYSELERSGLVKSDRTVGRFVTDDADLIQNLRESLIHQKVVDFVSEAQTLGLGESIVLNLVSEAYRQKEKNV